MFLTKTTEAETYLEKFSETGLPVFERAAALTRERAQYHLVEGHIIVALFQIAPDWITFRISQNGVMPEQILTAAKREIEETKPFTKGGLKIHPSATIFLRKATKMAKAAGRSQIDCVDLIAALNWRIKGLKAERENSGSTLIKIFGRLKKLSGSPDT